MVRIAWQIGNRALPGLPALSSYHDFARSQAALTNRTTSGAAIASNVFVRDYLLQTIVQKLLLRVDELQKNANSILPGGQTGHCPCGGGREWPPEKAGVSLGGPGGPFPAPGWLDWPEARRASWFRGLPWAALKSADPEQAAPRYNAHAGRRARTRW
jgi:hypothetical protein